MYLLKRMFLLILVVAFVAHGYFASRISAEILDACEDRSGNIIVITQYSPGFGEKFYTQSKKIAPSGKSFWSSAVRKNLYPGRLFADHRATMPTMTIGDDGSIYMISYLDVYTATRLHKWDPKGDLAWTRDMPLVRGLALVSGDGQVCVAGQGDKDDMPLILISFDSNGNPAPIQNPAYTHKDACLSGVDGNQLIIRNLRVNRILWVSPKGQVIRTAPIVSDNSFIGMGNHGLFSWKDGHPPAVVCRDFDGTIRWHTPLPNAHSIEALAVDGRGNAYATTRPDHSRKSNLVKLNQDGCIKWEKDLEFWRSRVVPSRDAGVYMFEDSWDETILSRYDCDGRTIWKKRAIVLSPLVFLF